MRGALMLRDVRRFLHRDRARLHRDRATPSCAENAGRLAPEQLTCRPLRPWLNKVRSLTWAAVARAGFLRSTTF